MATARELITRLTTDQTIRTNRNSPAVIERVGDALLQSFGLNTEQPQIQPNIETGFTQAQKFLRETSTTFTNPTNIIGIAPFAHAYLGSDTFNTALDIVLARARAHPHEQPKLDEVFTAASLITPSKRKIFLESVRTAQDISDDLWGLDSLIIAADPSARFTNTGEFPSQFHTSDVRHAMDLLGVFLGNGFYTPARGFSAGFEQLEKDMKGFEYLLSAPEDGFTLLIGNNIPRSVQDNVGNTIESTPKVNQRPNSNGKNPALIVTNQATTSAEITHLYPRSTVLYLEQDTTQRQEMIKAVGDQPFLLLPPQVNAAPKATEELISQLRAYRSYIARRRQEGITNLHEMVSSDISRAVELARAGSDHYYQIHDTLTTLNRNTDLDAVIADQKITLPLRTNNDLILIITNDQKDLPKYFTRDVTRKRVEVSSTLPDVKKTGLPFVLITDQPLPEEKIQQSYPGATVLYLARGEKAQDAIMNANPQGVYVFDPSTISGNAYHIGSALVNLFFDPISRNRSAGTTKMTDIVSTISQTIKGARDKILFAPMLRDYYPVAVHYFELQERYKVAPLIAQQTDEPLMLTCPTGGCFKLRTPEQGGCCGGGNLPRVLIDFAAAYRKQVGDEEFWRQVENFNKGPGTDPWYTQDRTYSQQFPQGRKITPTNVKKDAEDLTF